MSDLSPLISQLVKEKNIQTVSIDVFDTLVFRRVGRPVDVFAQAYTHCQASLNLTMACEEFQELRIYAEKQAKRDCQSGEATLEEIYQNLPFEDDVRQTLKAAELLIESQCSFVYPPMLALIANLLASGKSVILISDMYLSSEQIRQCFFAQHLQLQALPLYVSSEYRLNKATGSLFDYLADKLVLDRNTWLHLGDNRNSDFLVPEQKGINTKLLTAELNIEQIFKLEQILFSQTQAFNSARFIAATHYVSSAEPVAFNIGALVWGPILLSFTDWVIDQTMKANSECILCLMREAEVFAPLLELRLQQRNIIDISVKKLYASRKSTFWAAIDTHQDSWFEDLIYILVQRRGYTVDDFYRDFFIQHNEIHAQYNNTKVRDTDGLFYQGNNLLKQLTELAKQNVGELEAYIKQQKALFIRYYQLHIGVDLFRCSVLDLGGGGTIQHQIELILSENSAANLLFYSSERIYRFLDKSVYTSFLNARSDIQNLRQTLARSPECIEPFLVGDCGTTLGYQDDACGSPIMAENLYLNSAPVKVFLQGVLSYTELHHDLGLGEIEVEQVLPILYRYIQLPTHKEAELFTRILHQDNFGSNDAYPIVTPAQITQLSTIGIETFYLEYCRSPRVQLGKVHWPQAVMTLINENFLAKQLGLMSMNTDNDVAELVERLIDCGWQRFSVYGAGQFFEKLLPYVQKHNLDIVHLIDRKAEISGAYQVAGFEVISLKQAMQLGSDKILICSFAFKNEIARNIYDQSIALDCHGIEVLSL